MLLGLRSRLLSICLTLPAACTSVFAENRVSLELIDRPVATPVPTKVHSWTIHKRECFWPLVRQSAEHLEAISRRIGTGDQVALAYELERLAAWLKLTQASGMTISNSGIINCVSMATDAARSLRDGDVSWNEKRLNDLVVFGYLCVAESHITRSVEFDNNFLPPPGRSGDIGRSPLSRVLRQLELEIEAERIEQATAQYRYDTLQAARHYQAALYYLGKADDTGHLDVDLEELRVVEFPEDFSDRDEVMTFAAWDLRPALDRLQKVISPAKRHQDSKLIALRN